MTAVELAQLYVPLAGLVALAFWTGMLSQRVKTLEAEASDVKGKLDDGAASGERLVRLEVQMQGANDHLASIERNMSGIQRQLANFVNRDGLPPKSA